MIAEAQQQRRPLGELLDALDDATEMLLAAAKRAPRVKPNGQLRTMAEKLRAASEDLQNAGRK